MANPKYLPRRQLLLVVCRHLLRLAVHAGAANAIPKELPGQHLLPGR